MTGPWDVPLSRSARTLCGAGACAALVVGGVMLPPAAPARRAGAPVRGAVVQRVPPPSPAAIDLARRARRLEARALAGAPADTSGDTLAAAGRSPFGTVRDPAAADSAIAAFDSLATLVPGVADWLALRAAALVRDEGARARRLDAVRLPVARARVARAEATARARVGDFAGALRALDAAGDSVGAARVRLAIAGARAPGDGTGEAPPADDSSRAAAAALLVRRGRARDGAGAWGMLADSAKSPPLRAWARLQQGRALVRAGDEALASTALERLVAEAPDDTAAAEGAWLLADRAAAAGREEERRRWADWLAERHAASPWAARTAFEGILVRLPDTTSAAVVGLEAIAARWPDTEQAPAALYWAGRLRLAIGDSAGAAARWARVLEGWPLSYHAALAATRLARPLPAPATGDEVRADAAAVAGVDRMTALELLGLTAEAALERESIARAAGDDPARLLAASAAYLDSRRQGVGIALAQRAVERGAPRTAPVLRLLYPLPHRALVLGEASRRGVDPWLAAALIRQESRFTPDARSAVGARGLMQLMPEVAQAIARGQGLRVTPAMLDDPAVNVPLGMRHLAGDLARWRHPAYALAAYNAGGSRVTRWRARPGGDDPELFTERIPFAETRDYVRTVLATAALYRALHADAGDAAR